MMQSIDEGAFVDLGGVPQWLTLRGADRGNPALLLVGGAGFGYAALAPFFADWERDFTLVQWDQRGAGFTFARSGVEVTTMAQLVADGIAVAEYACARLGARKLALACFSGGTIVGLEMVKRRPGLFSAYVGNGQVVDWARQDTLSYERLLERARVLRDASMLQELTAIGAPPYADAATDAVKSKYAGAPTPREAAAFGELGPLVGAALQGLPAGATYLAPGLRWPEPRARSFAAYTALRGDIVSFDARRLGLDFTVPMFFLQGADDVYTVSSEVESYAAELVAPHVEYVAIAGAGHAAMFLRHEVHALLQRHVRATLLRA
ncbi:MAG TPA: alpha/beta hydrolase [Gammaproteobacteria bacterium]|nr:alpha/beta hydrolase [Gammaproteobacteria bacterium]